jgi:hypothetical protein
VQLTRRFVTAWAVLAVGGAAAGWQVATAIGENPPTVADTQTRTVHSTVVHRQTRFVTVRVHVPAKIINRFDHVIVWRTARYVFVYRGHRHVIPPHVVRVVYRRPYPGSPPVALVQGVAPVPVTVTVPVTVDVPGPTTTVQGPTTTVSLPQATTTVTVATTVTLPLSETSTPTGGQSR